MVKIKMIPLYAVFILSFFSLFSCDKTNTVDMLNLRIDELVNIIESHKEHEINKYLTDDFSVVKRFNKKQFFLFLHYHLKRNTSISISLVNKEITLNKNYADVTADVFLLGSNEWIPEKGQMYTIASRWKRVKGDWEMSNLRWEIK